MLFQLDLDLTNYILDHCDEENCFNGRTTWIFSVVCLTGSVHGQTLPFITQTRHWEYVAQWLFRRQKENIEADKMKRDEITSNNKSVFVLADLKVLHIQDHTIPRRCPKPEQQPIIRHKSNRYSSEESRRFSGQKLPGHLLHLAPGWMQKVKKGARSNPNMESTGTFFS